MDRIALVPDITHLLYNYISKTGVVVLFIYFFCMVLWLPDTWVFFVVCFKAGTINRIIA